MIINGQKWSCETCIKGHRATSCNHTNRQLTLIKKKGRPATQCLKCRELRLVRQLHRRCDCVTESDHKKRDVIKEQQPIRKREKEKKQKNPRRLAPKQSILDSVKEMDLVDHQEMDHSIDILDCMDYTKPTPLQLASGDGCSKQASVDPHCTKAQQPEENKSEPVIELLAEDDRQPSSVHCCDPTRQPAGDRNAASACLGPPAKNDQGETIRLVTCRCGDDCACIGCDAHPSRAMKEGKKDVYVGFSETRRLSVVSLWPIENQASSFLSQEGCGCSKRMENCSECLLQLWYPDFV